MVNHQYDIISNIAVHDGLINGAECCIKYIQEQENKSNFPAIVWVQFEDNHLDQNNIASIGIYRSARALILTGHQFLHKKELSCEKDMGHKYNFHFVLQQPAQYM